MVGKVEYISLPDKCYKVLYKHIKVCTVSYFKDTNTFALSFPFTPHKNTAECSSIGEATTIIESINWDSIISGVAYPSRSLYKQHYQKRWSVL